MRLGRKRSTQNWELDSWTCTLHRINDQQRGKSGYYRHRLGMASYLKATMELAATGAGWGWAKWIPFAGAAVDAYSAYHDASQAYSDYSSAWRATDGKDEH